MKPKALFLAGALFFTAYNGKDEAASEQARIMCHESSCTTQAYHFQDFDRDGKVDVVLDRKSMINIQINGRSVSGRNYRSAGQEEAGMLQRSFENAKSAATGIATDSGQYSCLAEGFGEEEFYLVRCIDKSLPKVTRSWRIYPPFDSVFSYSITVHEKEEDRYATEWVDDEKYISYINNSPRAYYYGPPYDILFTKDDPTGKIIFHETKDFIRYLEAITGAKLVVDGKKILP